MSLHAYDHYVATEKLAVRIANAQAAKARSDVPKPGKQELEDAKKWAALAAERNFAWDALFAAVERTASRDIELLEFQPDKQSETVILSGEAKDYRALVAFLEALAAQPALHNVYLSHEQSLAHDRLETVSFEIKAMIK
jgi:hypothetical protein